MRLFLALELTPQAREALARAEQELRPRCPGWRWVRPEGIHLTIRFLGHVDPPADAELRAVWRGVAALHGVTRFRLAGVGTFPDRKRPRVLWVGVQEETPAGNLSRLAAATERAARVRGFAAERRPFRSHLTLARAARGGRPEGPPRDFEFGATTVVAEHLVLFESRLGAGGARYTRLESFPLAG